MNSHFKIRLIFLFICFICFFSPSIQQKKSRKIKQQTELLSQYSSNHTNNWAVLVDTSRYWFNYRHIANTLSFYRTVKKLGIPDDHIILMLADDMACNPRNSYPGTVYNNHHKQIDLYGDNIEVDYRGYEVSVENFIRLLSGRHPPSTPRSKRLLTDSNSNVFIYMTGHGGNEFLKFHDYEEITSHDLADVFEQMWQKKRYNELLFVIDTCQANTLYKQFYSPNILAIGSSELGQNSLSHHGDHELGLAVIDRFSYYTMEYFEKKKITMESKETIYDLFTSYDLKQVMSTPGIRTDLYLRPLESVLLTDFFGHVPKAQVVENLILEKEDFDFDFYNNSHGNENKSEKNVKSNSRRENKNEDNEIRVITQVTKTKKDLFSNTTFLIALSLLGVVTSILSVFSI